MYYPMCQHPCKKTMIKSNKLIFDNSINIKKKRQAKIETKKCVKYTVLLRTAKIISCSHRARQSCSQEAGACTGLDPWDDINDSLIHTYKV